jgi:four helix bundle protein
VAENRSDEHKRGDGVLGRWVTKMSANYRNRNRGYESLRVWADALEYYVATCRVFRGVPFELKRVASQQIASADSGHRNIAEGYCRRSRREYLNFLNYALGSVGESVSGLHAYRKAEQISESDFERLDTMAYKLENGLLRLVESLEPKRDDAEWEDQLIIKESNLAYNVASDSEANQVAQHPNTPTPRA